MTEGTNGNGVKITTREIYDSDPLCTASRFIGHASALSLHECSIRAK